MKIIIYDIILLILFVIFISIFLYRNKKNLKREGLLFLYKTKWGIKFINNVGKKYRKTLKVLSYVSIGMGYILMVSVLYLVGKIIYLYVAYPQIVRAIKVPPIMPLIPYIDRVAPSLNLPSFYFIYFIIIIAIIAITHEFSHGIFMRRYGIKIKSTGFGFFPFFLPIFPLAFVEQNEKSMNKSKGFNQMAVLSAGTFANVLTAVLFFIIMWLFFSLAFTPSGVIFNDYSYSMVGMAGISAVNNISVNNATYGKILELVNETGLSEIRADGGNYFATKDFLKKQQNVGEYVFLYDDTPAIKAGLEGTITEVDGVKITSLENFQEELLKNSPGDKVNIKTKIGGETKEYGIVLGENPEDEKLPYLGIGFVSNKDGILGTIVNLMSSFRESNMDYEPKFDAGWFIFNLLWWLVLISLTVALVNMLPVGIFDGGKFFYLTILGLTKSEKKAEKAFRFVTYLFIFLLLVLMMFWILSFLG